MVAIARPLKSRLSLPYGFTFLSFLLFEQNESFLRKRSSLRMLAAISLAKNSFNRHLFFNFLCLLEVASKSLISLKYYYKKLIYCTFRSLVCFSYYARPLLLRLESFTSLVPLNVFTCDWFCFNRAIFSRPLIIPFNRFYLRLDVFSFFFLWTGMEHIRISYYNRYIRHCEGLWQRPWLKRAFIQSWFPRRRMFLGPHPLPILHLPIYDSFGMRKLLNDRFIVMHRHRKYIILALLEAVAFRYKDVKLPFSLNQCFLENKSLSWLAIFTGCHFSPWSDFFKSWDFPQVFRLYFLYFMRYPKRYPLDKWRITRYYVYLTKAMVKTFATDELYTSRAMVSYSLKHTRSLQKDIFNSHTFSSIFLLRDLYNYHSFSWENFISFIDRRFCYRILAMKYNWFFDRYFLEAHGRYMATSFHLIRPFYRKDTPYNIIPRRRAFFFAKRFLLRFCHFPLHFSYIFLGLEYYFWRIYEVIASSRWTDDILPLAYYCTKLDIDRLLLSRHSSLLSLLQPFIEERFPQLYRYSSFVYKKRNKAMFQPSRWQKPLFTHHVNPWLWLRLSSFKSVFLQSLSQKALLAFLHWFFIRPQSLDFFIFDFTHFFYKRCCVCFSNVESFHRYIQADAVKLIHLGVDWKAPRAKKWLCSFKVKTSSKIKIITRYAKNYSWKRANVQKQIV